MGLLLTLLSALVFSLNRILDCVVEVSMVFFVLVKLGGN